MIIKGEYNYLLIEIDKNLEGKIIRDVLRDEAGVSRRLITNAKKSNKILLNNKVCQVNRVVYEGDELVLRMDEKSNIEPENKPIDVMYEDKDVIVINKEPFSLVHPTKNHENNTLLNRVIHYAMQKNEVYKPHLVNRLDRDTSGLLVIAKNPYAHYELMKQMDDNSFEKKYLAVTKGGFKNKEGILDFNISDKKHDGINRLVSEDGKKSVTRYKVLEDNEKLALLELELLTGRTHQIRVHLNEIGHPLVGDELYGGFALNLLNRQALHAYSLKFKSPRNKKVSVKVDLASDITLFFTK